MRQRHVENLEQRTLLAASMVLDINPGAAGSAADLLAASGSEVYFKADDGTHGAELWRSDGTVSGTHIVQDIESGAGGSYPGNILDLGGTVLFTATNGQVGTEPWRVTGGGASPILDLYPGAAGSSATGLTVFNGLAYFMATGKLLPTDSFRSGIWRNRRHRWRHQPGGHNWATGPPSSRPSATRCFFVSDDLGSSRPQHGSELWKTDGTGGGHRAGQGHQHDARSIGVDRRHPLLFSRAAHQRQRARSISPRTTAPTGWNCGAATARPAVPCWWPISGPAPAAPTRWTSSPWTTAASSAPRTASMAGNCGSPIRTAPAWCKDIYLDTSASDPSFFASLNGKLYFAATDARARAGAVVERRLGQRHERRARHHPRRAGLRTRRPARPGWPALFQRAGRYDRARAVPVRRHVRWHVPQRRHPRRHRLVLTRRS